MQSAFLGRELGNFEVNITQFFFLIKIFKIHFFLNLKRYDYKSTYIENIIILY